MKALASDFDGTLYFEDGVKEAIAPLLVKFGSYGKAPKVERVTIDEMAERYRKAGI